MLAPIAARGMVHCRRATGVGRPWGPLDVQGADLGPRGNKNWAQK